MKKFNSTVTADCQRMVKNQWLIVKAAGSGFTGVASRFQMPFFTLVTNRAGSVATACRTDLDHNLTNLYDTASFLHVIK